MANKRKARIDSPMGKQGCCCCLRGSSITDFHQTVPLFCFLWFPPSIRERQDNGKIHFRVSHLEFLF